MDNSNNSANMKLSPGMLCLVINAHRNMDNIGKIVTTIRYLNGGDFIPELGGFAAVASWLIHGEFLTITTTEREVDKGDFTLAGRQDLMPIRPEEDPLEITDVITKKEKA